MRAAHDLIVAVSTPPGSAGIGMVRLSGAGAADLAAEIAGRPPPPSHTAALRDFRDRQGQLIDRGVMLVFGAPRSFTGQDVLELHCHGGPAVLQSVVGRCLELGARAANPGEFSLRAYLNGKIDLAQAEAIADLVNASTESAARAAARTLQGELSAEIARVGERLVDTRALLEANLDFPEEEVPPTAEREVEARISGLAGMLARLRERGAQGVLLGQGARAAIVGAPNVGKSSLLNRLSGEDTAIVTDIPGTTRDPVRETVALDGVRIEFVDTAGIRESPDPVETEGIARSRRAAGLADLVIRVDDPGTEGQAPPVADGAPGLSVHNKIDLAGAGARRRGDDVWVSAKTGEGIDLLRAAILEKVGHAAVEAPCAVRPRQLDAIGRAHAHCVAALAAAHSAEIAAEALREAHDALGEITGRMAPDELLGEIFSRFCIGK